MITGTVAGAREAIVRLEVYTSTGQPLDIEFVIDTGFTEELLLPASLVSALNLPYLTTTYAMMGDGSVVALDV